MFAKGLETTHFCRGSVANQNCKGRVLIDPMWKFTRWCPWSGQILGWPLLQREMPWQSWQLVRS